ncbi:MAG: NAD(P)H-hydrate dehydratase [Hyphomonadaceae bacterium]
MTTAILTCDEVRVAEQRSVEAGLSLWALMQKAGQACADVLHAEFPDGRVIVLAGPGNNGGDAFVAAQRLRDLGRNVWLYDLAPKSERTPEGQNALNALTGPRQPLEDMRVHTDDIVLDGLFGAGLSRPLAGEAAFAVEQVNASGAKVVAIDVPSGINGDTGAITGPAIGADVTVTFCCKKPAHVLQPAASQCGEVVPAEIGFGKFLAEVGGNRLNENAPSLWSHALRWPTATSHKHQRGRLAVVSGGLANTGAARLAAHAGLRSGAGLVTVLCPPAALMVVASSVTAVMTSSFASAEDLVVQTERSTAIVIGPAAGVTDATRANVEALARTGRSLVLDADALTVFAGKVETLRSILSAPAILTPHTGEFERLFPGVLASSSTRIEAVRAASKQVGCIVLLKGPDTTIAAPDGRAVINTHATPFLATAGAGDVLAGIIGGLLAQGLDPFAAACAGAWMHGDAGLRIGAGLTAEDLDAALRDVIRGLYAGRHGTVI